ncbi:MAG: metallophosphoesterase [Clostridia bacterium]|nr:metallophosphoesterase [Clostridia bacterium]
MNIIETEVNIDLTSPFEVIHMSDTHFTLADERDGERKMRLAENRVDCFSDPLETYNAAKKLAFEKNCPIVHTGDFIDFVSEKNLEMVRLFREECDVFYAAGNHDFSLYCGEAWEDADYRNISLAKVQACHGNDIRMSSRVIGGVNFIALDDGYFRFDSEHIDFVKREAEMGLPIVLLIHKPIYNANLFAEMVKIGRDKCLAGVPDEHSKWWSEDEKQEVCPDGVTREAVAYFKSEERIKAFICGHLHLNYEGKDERGRPVLLTDTETLRVIRFT